MPFDRSNVQRRAVQSDGTLSNSATAEQEVEATSKDFLRDDWHAEVELVEPWQQKMTESIASRLGIGVQERASQPSHLEADFVDNAIVHDLHEPSTPPESRFKAPLLPADPNVPSPISAASLGSSTPAGSRAESRQQRKLRRIEAGTYNRANARPLPREQAMEARAKSILNFMKVSRGIPEATEAGDDSSRRTEASLKARVESTPEKKPTSKEQIPTRRNPEGTERKIIAKDKVLLSATATTQDSMPEPPKDQTKREREPWQVQKDALRDKFGERGWQPRKRLSPDTVEGIRALHASDPSSYTTPILAEHFKVTPEAIRRILRSKWRPNEEEADDRRKRWEKRGERKWEAMAAQGVRPPAKWRAKGIKTPEAERKKHARLVGDGHVRWDDRSLASVGLSLASRIA